jgi:hypothetical protein
MVIFAITALVYPYLKGWQKVLPWALVNVQVLGLAAAVRDGRLRFGGGRGVAVVAERGFGDDPGL